MYVRSFLVLLLATLAASASAQTSVRDSLRMTLGIYQYATVTDNGGYNCGAGVYAIWPNVLQSLLGAPGRTYGYRDYGRVATDDMYIPSGYGEAVNNPDVGLTSQAASPATTPSSRRAGSAWAAATAPSRLRAATS